MRRIGSLVTLAYVLVDFLLMALAFCVPHTLYYHSTFSFTKTHLLLYAFWMVVTILFFYSAELYHTLRELTIWRETKRVLRAFLFATLSTLSVSFFLKVHTLSRLVFVSNVALALLLLIAWRILKRSMVRYLVARGFNNWNVLIVGAGRVGKRLTQMFEHRPELGLRIVGFLDDHIPAGTAVKGKTVLGGIGNYAAIAKRHFVDRVFVTIPSERDIVSQIVFHSKLYGISVHVIPEHFDLETNDIRLYTIDGMPVLEYHSVLPNYRMMIIKRLMDIIVSSLALFLLLPLMALVGIAIKADSAGPIFYIAKRWGKKGQLFNCYKFRSMVADAESLRSQLESANEMDGPVFKMKNDPRLTRVGRWLRRYSIDEIPQFWNVLKGDMSLVGPRPLPEREEVGGYKLDYLSRLSIKPGLTCLWQISGRNHIPFRRWMKLDDYYIRNWSPQMDLAILLRTFPAVFKAKGAY